MLVFHKPVLSLARPYFLTGAIIESRSQASLLTPPEQSRSQSFVPLDQRSENESSGSIHFQITMEITEICISGFTAHACAVHSLPVWYLWRMPEMDAPRALVFRPLVKGNEALGTRLLQPSTTFPRASFLDQRSKNECYDRDARWYSFRFRSSTSFPGSLIFP